MTFLNKIARAPPDHQPWNGAWELEKQKREMMFRALQGGHSYEDAKRWSEEEYDAKIEEANKEYESFFE